jgi:DNA-binding Lrp family transcriptional regulator
MTTFTIQTKQSELAKELGITRQALNVHLRRLRNGSYIRTGRGFIDITEKGLKALGLSADPTFVFLKISPHKRNQAYKAISALPIQRVFRVAGDMDLLLLVDSEKLDVVLRQISLVEGIENTHSYVTIEAIK